MHRIELADVPALAPLVGTGAQEPVFITENGHFVGVVVPVADDDVESMLLSINPQFQSILDRLQQRLESEGGLSSKEVKKLLGLPLTDG